METPKDLNAVLHSILKGETETPNVLTPEDEAYLTKLLHLVRAGKPAVLLVEAEDEKIRYMFSNVDRPEAIEMLGKVVSGAARSWRESGP